MSFNHLVLSLLVCAAAALLPAAPARAEGFASKLLFAPNVGVATQNSALVNVAAGDDPLKVFLRYRKLDAKQPEAPWTSLAVREIPPARGVDFELDALAPDTRYEFEVRNAAEPYDSNEGAPLLDKGAFITQRSKAAEFSFALISDAHISALSQDGYRMGVLRGVADTALRHQPDFVLMLGDNMQTIGSAHAGYALDPKHPYVFHLRYRYAAGSLLANAATYTLNGNWEGENGWHPAKNRAWSREARMNLLPNPNADSYPEGGSTNEDYYAMTWGDALIVVLNATGYTPVDHGLDPAAPGKPDDWTLGAEQYVWLEKTLKNSKARWKFMFSHHVEGGNAGDADNSRYGRGAGRAAKVGEQAKIHALMRKYGVSAFFVGHDHVYADMTVDGIHYTVVGSAGAPWKFGTAETGYTDFRTESGFVLVSIKENAADVAYIRPDDAKPGGEKLDGYTMPAPGAGKK